MSGGNTVKALDADDNPNPYSYDTISHLEVLDIGQITATKLDNNVKLEVNNTEIQFYVDSGCQKTIIPQSQYTASLGPMQPTKTKFRPYGTLDYLATLGEIPVCLKTNNGAVHSTTIYVVQGHKIESLLGDQDAKALGILTINKGGYTPFTRQHKSSASSYYVPNCGSHTLIKWSRHESTLA